MTAGYFRIRTRYGVNANDYYEYRATLIKNVDDDLPMGGTPFNAPNQPHSSTQMFRFMGQIRKFAFDIDIRERPNDTSGGTAPGGDFPTGVKTRIEQRDYLYNFMAHYDHRAIFLLQDDLWFPVETEVSWDRLNNRQSDTEDNAVVANVGFTIAANIIRTWEAP